MNTSGAALTALGVTGLAAGLNNVLTLHPPLAAPGTLGRAPLTATVTASPSTIFSNVARSATSALAGVNGGTVLRGASLVLRGLAATNPVTLVGVTALSFLADRLITRYLSDAPPSITIETKPQAPQINTSPPGRTASLPTDRSPGESGFAVNNLPNAINVHNGGTSVRTPPLGGFAPYSGSARDNVLLSQGLKEWDAPKFSDALDRREPATSERIRSQFDIAHSDSFPHLTRIDYKPTVLIDGTKTTIPPMDDTPPTTHPITYHGFEATHSTTDDTLTIYVNKTDARLLRQAHRTLGDTGDMLGALLDELGARKKSVASIHLNLRPSQTERGQSYNEQVIQNVLNSDRGAATPDYAARGDAAESLHTDIAAVRVAKERGYHVQQFGYRDGYFQIDLHR